ncbi:M12 family metallo-peptidase [Marinicella sediminis]|uniref:M12 family metallo-peptidase n=1 Tax=Marinicella sediminis TaxID=1792834 RepID=A0ABV7J9C9_9GAMM|nr:M12 family metallo-peptidase [Marinicella sediminis]
MQATNLTFILSLFLLTVLSPMASAKVVYPEAYAGLNPQAYHPITLVANKTGGLSYQWQNTLIEVPEAQLNKSATSANQSFIQNIKGGVIKATAGTNSLFGDMHVDNTHYILTTNQSGIWAVELPDHGVQYNDCGLDHQAEHTNLTAAAESTNSKAAGTIIDVLMLYDQAIADRYPGALLQARVDQYFFISNQAYANSGLDLAVRQVGLEQVGYDLDDANINLLNLLQSALSLGVGSHGLQNVPQLYADSGADLVIFLRTHNIETRGNCGIAFFPVSTAQSNFDPSYGVNIMADGMSSWSVCTDQLMVHEIGHNLGAGHHNESQQNRYIPDAAGFAKLGQFGTVMGSFGTGQPDRFLELDYFSNPAVQCGGGPCGIEGQFNNVNVINQLKGPVSAYQAAVSPAPLPPDFTTALIDQDGDGVLDRDDEFPFDANESIDSDGDGVGDISDVFPALASEQIDTDSDGIGNNSDFDDDGDGILDVDDAFPLNPNEVSDSDQDGYGDISDAFVFEASEHLDSDNDNIGNNDDIDDDNDGVADLDLVGQDILVISVGNNRILRFDAQTGLSKGLEVLPEDGLFTFQSDLTYDDFTNQLFFTSASSVQLMDLQDPYGSPSVLIPPYANTGAQLGTGFPTALHVSNDRNLITAKLRGTSLDAYSYSNIDKPSQFFYAGLNGVNSENIIAIKQHQEHIYLLGLETEIYRGQVNGGTFASLGVADKTWLVDPYDFVITDDDRLLHTDQGRNKVVITDLSDVSFGGIFADLVPLGYSNPTGIDLTNDGRVLVTATDQNAILSFDLDTGEFLGTLVAGFGLNQPHKLLVVPQLKDRFHKDADKVLRPNAGNWYNPATAGRGFNIGIFNNRLQVLWFTFDEDGLPVWYTSAGLLDGHNYSAELLRSELINGTPEFEIVGQLEIEFINERQATVDWQIGAFSDSEPLEWFQFSLEPELEYLTGMWSRPDTPGWGLAVTTNGDKTVSIPFVFDDNGQPRWAISDVATGKQPFVFNMGTSFSDSLCPSCTGNTPPEITLSGTMGLDLSDQAYWDSDITWPDPIPGSWLLDQTELVRISSAATRPR